MDKRIREQIREEMARQKISQAALARQLGIQPPSLAQILSGKRGIVPESLLNVLAALGIALEAVPSGFTGAAGAVWTVGVNDWGAKGVPAMLEAISAAGVSHLWDVRDNTVTGPFMSNWAKVNLSDACTAAGIEYVSHKDLGVPKDIREALNAVGVSDQERRAGYAGLLTARRVKLAALRAELEGQRAAFLCACKSDGRACHRFVLAELLGLTVDNLTAQPKRGK